MNISGVLVRARPERMAEVEQALRDMPGVDVHASTAEGRLVITIEQADGRSMADTMVALHDLPGVIAASMVYHQYDPGADDAGPDHRSLSRSQEESNETESA